MGPQDSAVWAQILTLGLMPAERLDYDTRLAGALAEEVETDHPHFPMWLTLLQKRVDVVAWRKGIPWLVEVKPQAGFAALGQALGYCDLWEREKGTQPKPVPCVCCAVCDRDLEATFSRYGVEVVSLPVEIAEQVLSGLRRAPGSQSP